MKVCAAEAEPWVALKPLRDAGLTVNDGAALTVPKTDSVADVVPELETLTVPLSKPAAADAAMRISIDAAATVPLTGDMLAEDAYAPDPARRSSYPGGAVTFRSPVRSLPLTEKVCAADAVPAVVTNPDKVPEIATEGAGAPTVPEISLVTGEPLPARTETSPLSDPIAALAAIRTLTVAFTPPLVGAMVPSAA